MKQEVIMLIDKIIAHLKTVRTASSWELANAIYDNCMNFPHRSNGAKIASIVKACYKYPHIDAYYANNEQKRYFITAKSGLKKN